MIRILKDAAQNVAAPAQLPSRVGTVGPGAATVCIFYSKVALLCCIDSSPTGVNMTTTTIRIEDDLKARVAAAAEKMGKTAHAFILDALAATVEQVELDATFHALADERWANIRATGKAVAWDDAKAYLAGRANGERPRKPNACKLTK